MNIKLTYNLASLHAAAAFIWDNNPSVRKWPSAPTSELDVLELIHSDMVRYASQNARTILSERTTGVDTSGQWVTHTGTGGYYLLFSLLSDEDSEDIAIGIDILVDAGVTGPASRYKAEVIDISLSTV